MLKTKTASLTGSLLLLALCASGPALAQTPAPAPNAPSRIGFVFTERLYTESKLAKAADAKIEAEFSKRQKVRLDMAARYKALTDKFDNESANLSEAERTKRVRELLDLEKDLQRTEREFREDLMQRKNEERSIIAQKAYKLIEQIAEQEHLDVVLQESVWVSPRVDLTDKILKQLDK
jgi:outer membrane protein